MRLLLCLPSCILALSARETPKPLSLPAYVEAVLQANLEAAARKFDVSSAEAQVALAGLLPDPELSLGVSSRELHRPAQPESPTQHNAGLAWTLELGGKRAARVATAQAEVKRSRAEFDAFLNDLRASAIGTFADALRARQLLEQKRKTQAGFQELIRLNEIRHRTGDIGGVELMQSRLEAQRFDGEVFAAEADLVRAETALAALAAGRNLRAEGSLALPVRTFDLEALLASAQASRPDLLLTRRALDSGLAQRRLAQANRWVDLGLSLGVNHTPPLYSEAPAPMSNSLSLGLSVPLPFSRRQKGELLQAEHAVSQNRLRLQAAEQQTRADVASALAQYEAASRQLGTFRDGMLQDASKVLEGLQFSYKRGAASLLEWITAQRTHLEVHMAFIEAQTAHVKALAELDRVTGLRSSLGE